MNISGLDQHKKGGEDVSGKKIVIIGLGGAPSNVARPAKRLDASLTVTILKEEDLLIRRALPYVATEDATLDDSIKGDEMFPRLSVRQVNSIVTKIDRKNKGVTDAIGDVYPDDKIALNLGGVAAAPPIAGRDFKGVFVLHNPEDTHDIRD